MSVARPGDRDPGEPAADGGQDRAAAGPVHGLFQRPFAGDDALLELAGLRFAQMGVAAELYADTPDELERTLRFVPPHRYLPTVHLNRGINVLSGQGRSRVAEFADRFAGRVAGLVVHDKSEMVAQTDHVVEVMRELETRLRERPGRPMVFLEYAAGSEPEWFIGLAGRLLRAHQNNRRPD